MTLTRKQVEAVRERADAATPGPRLDRYEHGGGRAWIEEGGGRKLVADYYHVEDREFYHAARADVPVLSADLLAAMERERRVAEMLVALIAPMERSKVTSPGISAGTLYRTKALLRESHAALAAFDGEGECLCGDGGPANYEGYKAHCPVHGEGE